MSINFSSFSKEILNVSRINKTFNNRVSFCGLQQDEFIKSDSTPENLSVDEINKKISELHDELDKSMNGPTYQALLKRSRRFMLSSANQKTFDTLQNHIDNIKEKLIYYNAILYNPKLAFLADKKNSRGQKLQTLSTHKEIATIDEALTNIRAEMQQLSKNDTTGYKGLIKVNSPVIRKAFGAVPLIEDHTGNHYRNKFNSYNQYIDTSLPTYSENIKILKASADKEVMSKTKYKAKLSSEYGIRKDVISRHLKDFKPMQLKAAATNEFFNTNWYDINSEDNMNTVAHLQELSQKLTPELIEKDQPASCLIKLGYLDKDTLKNQIANKQIKANHKEVKKEDGTIANTIFIDLHDSDTIKTLLENKNKSQKVLSLRKLSQEYKISMATIEEAIIDGDLKIQKYAIREDNEVSVDVGDEENLLFLSRFQTPSMNDLSLRTKLAWKLASNAHEKLKNMITPDIPKLLSKEKEYDEYQIELEKIESEIESIEDDEDSAERLDELQVKKEEINAAIKNLNYSKDDKIKLSGFFKSFWKDENTRKEFSDASKKAIEILSLYSSQGIDAIEDEEIKNLILAHKKKQKN